MKKKTHWTRTPLRGRGRLLKLRYSCLEWETYDFGFSTLFALSRWSIYYEPWFNSPNHALAPYISFGVGNCNMESRNVWFGLMLSAVTVNPAKSTVSKENWNFFGFKVIPCLAQRSSQRQVWRKASSVDFAHIQVSSTHFTLFSKLAMIESNLCVYASPLAMKPCGATLYR